MDTISRENNSMLPVGSIIVGVVALLVGIFALVQASKANKLVAEHQAKIDQIDGIQQQAANAAAAADKANTNLTKLNQETQNAFNTVSNVIAGLQGSVTKLEDAAKKPAVAAATKGGKKGGAPVVAGPGEYIVKGGDTGMKIARANGVPLSALETVNPGVNWSRLHVGEKIKLPKK